MKSKKKVKEPKRKRTIWSFEPEPGVEQIINSYLAAHPETDRSYVIQDAIKQRFKEVFEAEERQLAKAKASFLERLSKSDADTR